MNTYKRIVKFVYPFWKHLSVAIVCTFFYSILNGASVYLSIPLLDTLFKQYETGTTEVVEEIDTTKNDNIMPDWVNETVDNISDSFHEFIFSGETPEFF